MGKTNISDFGIHAKEITSHYTLVAKFIAPLFCIFGIGWEVWTNLKQKDVLVVATLICFWAIISIFSLTFAFRLKRVWLVPNGLLVSSYVQKIVVRSENITEIKARRLNRGVIRIHFSVPTVFGKSIDIIPKQFSSYYLNHPIVQDLRSHLKMSGTIETS